MSVEEVEAELKGLKMESERKLATPFMVEHLEQTLTASSGPKHIQKKDTDMTAFNKLVNSMKASGTLPSQSKPTVSRNLTADSSRRLEHCLHNGLCIF